MRYFRISFLLGPFLAVFLVAVSHAPWFSLAEDKKQPEQLAAGMKAGQECSANGLKMRLCWCPPGKFLMGSSLEEPGRCDNEDQVPVTLTKGFWLGKHEVTQGEWQRVMGTSITEQRYKGDSSYYRKETAASKGEGDAYPVYSVNHTEAVEFCETLTKQERMTGRLPADWAYRLPTEAQWEYACRAGTTTATAFGNRLNSAKANFDGRVPYNGAGQGAFKDATVPVGGYPPNDWGLCDMHGNVCEWCSDWYTAELPGGDDPETVLVGLFRAIRGSSWYCSGSRCRSADRFHYAPDRRSAALGFRITAVQVGEGSPVAATSGMDQFDRKAILWFDGLGFPSLKDRTFGQIGSANSNCVREPDECGFLLSDDQDQYTVLTLALTTRTCLKAKPGEAGTWRDEAFEALDIAKVAQGTLTLFGEPQHALARLDPVDRRIAVFLLARGCAAHGDDELTHKLLQAAAFLYSPTDAGVKHLPATLSSEIAQRMMWRNVLELDQPSISRPQHLKRFQDFVKQFPHSEHAERARQTARILEQMVKEDELHAATPRKPLNEMTQKERIAELIYQLRDQNGVQFCQPGTCNVFLDPRDTWIGGEDLPPGGGSPATQLVNIGLEAVPQLFEHLDDQRLTRSIGFHRCFYFSHSALTVGDCVHQILQKICNRSLKHAKTKGFAALQVELNRWWSLIQ